MFAPGGEFLTITLGAAREFPGRGFPSTGGPACLTTAAAQRINADDSFEPFSQAAAVGNASVTRAAFGTF